jgi:POT family proton-dependent oligopeptide transporter
VLGFLAPVTWFNTLDGIMTIVGTALAVRIWAWQTGRTGKAKDVQRIAIGFALVAAAFLLLAFSAGLGGGGKAPLIPEVGFFILVDFAIPWIDTVTLTLVSRDAPASINTSMIGVYYLFVAAGNFLTGWLGGLADHLSMPGFWLVHAAIAGALLLLLLLAGTRLDRGLVASRDVAGAEPAPA